MGKCIKRESNPQRVELDVEIDTVMATTQVTTINATFTLILWRLWILEGFFLIWRCTSVNDMLRALEGIWTAANSE